jgi:signal transduction histidine kinase
LHVTTDISRTWGRRPTFLQSRFVLPAVIAVVQVVGTYGASTKQPEAARSYDAFAVLLLLAGPAALTVRRRYPVAVLTVTFAALFVYGLLGYPGGPIFLAHIVAFVTVVMSGRRLIAAGFLAAAFVSFLTLGPFMGPDEGPDLPRALAVAAWMLVLFAAAEVARSRRERAVEAERTRAEENARRASEERLRIARELHDVLAHNISLMNVQAGVALHLIDERPEQARAALAAIKQASNEALGELRSVLDILRHGNENVPRSPTSGLADLEDMISRAMSAGVRVDRIVTGTPVPLPSKVDLAAFRIIQEALTNVTRHAGRANARINLGYGEHDLTIVVEDDGGDGSSGGAAQPSGGGRGLRGMRERAEALGGELEAAPVPEGGFRVRARLPLTEGGTLPDSGDKHGAIRS